jgi:chemotaxis protein MotB
MKDKKHSKNSLIAIIVVIAISFSCVSSRKYDEALSSLARMKKDSTVTANQLATTQYNNSNEIYSLRSQVEEQQQQLDSLHAAVMKRQARLDEITGTLKEAFPNLNETNVSSNVEDGYVYFSLDHRVLFNRGEQSLSEDGKQILKKVSDVLQKAESDVMILGHTDSLPFHSPNYDNWMLSLERAHSVAEILVDKGVSPERLIIAGRGQYEPMFTNDHQVGQLLNRRIELVLMPDMEKVENIFAEHIP